MPSLRDAWTCIITAEDYERHMARIGQAQANAELLAGFFARQPPAAGTAILFPGAGTGQMFDFFDASVLAPYQVTFADINFAYLDKLAARLTDVSFRTVVDDAEHTALTGPFAIAIAILLLEHVDWRAAVAGLCRLAPCLYIGIQQNAPGVLPTSDPYGTMAVLREAAPHPIDPDQLTAELASRGFALVGTASRPTAGGKQMVHLHYRSSPRP